MNKTLIMFNSDNKNQTFNLCCICIFTFFVIVSYFFKGLDFAKGTLIGCFFVALNLFITKKILSSLLLKKKTSIFLLLVYICKLVIFGTIVYVSIFYLQVDPIGLVTGLTSVILISVLSMILRPS